MIQKLDWTELAAKHCASFGDHRMIAYRFASSVFACSAFALATNGRTLSLLADAETRTNREAEVLFAQVQKLLGVSAVLELITEAVVGRRKRKTERRLVSRRSIRQLIAMRMLKEACQKRASAADVLDESFEAARSNRLSGRRSGRSEARSC
jgi:hypothetical protein